MFAHIDQCKFVDRKTGARKVCISTVSRKKHRRGYCSIACSLGHTWVWCKHCCDCISEDGQLGCINAAHWFERDSFDTGRRNHMQRHVSTTVEVQSDCQNRKRKIDSGDCEFLPENERIVSRKTVSRLSPQSVKDGNVWNQANDFVSAARSAMMTSFSQHLFLHPNLTFPSSTVVQRNEMQTSAPDSFSPESCNSFLLNQLLFGAAEVTKVRL